MENMPWRICRGEHAVTVVSREMAIESILIVERVVAEVKEFPRHNSSLIRDIEVDLCLKESGKDCPGRNIE